MNACIKNYASLISVFLNLYHYLSSIIIYHLSLSLSLLSIIDIAIYALNRIFMHMIQITNQLFWDDFSLLSILPNPSFSYPHACLLLTHAHNNVIFNTHPL
nr:MAG TPA: hypothetical protein [Caudoviricetes sp.]